jgi:LTXXQ motif family protein
MSRRIVAGLAAGLAISAATLTLAVAAPHFGGGGGGAHFGGGGGGAHFGGGGGGAHFGGGGAPHFGGGGAPHFGGGGGGMPHYGGGGVPHGGGAHFGGGHGGGFAHHGGGAHVGHAGGPHGIHAGGGGHVAHTGHIGHGGAAGLAHHGGPAPGGHGLAHGEGAAHAGGGLAHATDAHPAAISHQQAGWLGHQFGQHNFDRHFGDRDRFFAQHGFRRGFFGWAGPVFWPYAYNDLFDYMFWPYDYYDDYYDPFWAYGYDDLFAGIFYPGDEADYGYGYGYGYAPSEPSGRRHHRVATNNSEVLNTPAGVAALCDQEATSTVAFPFDQIQQTLQLSAEQKAKLDDLKNAADQAIAALKASCPTQLAVTPVSRLEIVEGRLAAMLEALKTVSGPMDALYASLSDDQKLRFNQISLPGDRVVGKQPNPSKNGAATTCNQQAAGVVQFPIDAFDKAVHPNEAQRAELKDLSDAATSAAETIKASCPAEPPLSVPARLAAMQKRVDAMLEAVKLVRGPLAKFYSSLNDEQKARLNQINHPQRNAGG